MVEGVCHDYNHIVFRMPIYFYLKELSNLSAETEFSSRSSRRIIIVIFTTGAKKRTRYNNNNIIII